MAHRQEGPSKFHKTPSGKHSLKPSNWIQSQTLPQNPQEWLQQVYMPMFKFGTGNTSHLYINIAIYIYTVYTHKRYKRGFGKLLKSQSFFVFHVSSMSSPDLPPSSPSEIQPSLWPGHRFSCYQLLEPGTVNQGG